MNANTTKLLLDMDWNWHKFRSDEAIQQHYDPEFSDDEKDVFRCHLFEIDHQHLLATYKNPSSHNHSIPTDPRTGKSYPNFLVDSTTQSNVLKLFDKFTVKSTLKTQEHQACIRAISRVKERFKNHGLADMPMNGEERSDLEVYTKTFVIRKNEHDAFQQFAKTQFIVNYKSMIERVNPYLASYVKNMWQQSILDTKLTYPGHYFIQTAISLEKDSEMLSGETLVTVSSTIRQSGIMIGCKPTKRCRPPSMSTLGVLEMMKPSFNQSDLQVLALSNNADVVLSPDVVRQLIDFPANAQESWMISLEITDYHGSEYKKVCYINDPLPEINLSTKSRNNHAFQCHIRAVSTNPQSYVSYCLKDQKYCEPSTYNQSNEPNVDKSLDYKLIPFDVYMKHCRSATSDQKHIECSQVLRLADLKEGSSDAIRMVIRLNPTTFDAYKRFDTTPTVVNISIKLEYQPQFGAAQMTASELITEWCAHLFQPDCVTHRYRIVAESGQVLSVTRLTRIEIENEMLRLHKLRPNHMLQKLNQILRTIAHLPTNKYMLRHLPKHGNKVMLYTETDTKTANSIDISEMYAGDTDATSLDQIPWTPIDDMEVTRVHRQAKVTPCAFPHNIFAPKVGKLKPFVQNDRAKVVTRAKKKLADKKKVTAATKKRLAAQRKRIENAGSVLVARRQMLAKPIGDTIDPYLVFDAKGNMLVTELMSSAKTTSRNTSDEPIKMETSTTSQQPTLSWESYVNDDAGRKMWATEFMSASKSKTTPPEHTPKTETLTQEQALSYAEYALQANLL